MLQSLFQNKDFVTALLSVLMLASALCIALPVHEWAHAFVAYKQGDPTAKMLGRMTLAPHSHFDLFGSLFLVFFGFGWAKPVPIDERNFKHGAKSKVLVALAGITANLVVGTFFILVSTILKKYAPNYETQWGYYGVALKLFLNYVIQINFVLLFFNLLPVYPLDGFRVIESFASPYNSFVVFMKRYSWIIMLVLLLGTYLIDYYLTYTVGYTMYGINWLFEKIFGLV